MAESLAAKAAVDGAHDRFAEVCTCTFPACVHVHAPSAALWRVALRLHASATATAHQHGVRCCAPADAAFGLVVSFFQAELRHRRSVAETKAVAQGLSHLPRSG
jgi:hypothetical protein